MSWLNAVVSTGSNRNAKLNFGFTPDGVIRLHTVLGNVARGSFNRPPFPSFEMTVFMQPQNMSGALSRKMG